MSQLLGLADRKRYLFRDIQVGIVTLKRLPDDLRTRVTELRKKGDEFRETGDNLAALAAYQEAYYLIPEPKIEWSPGCWLLDNMGEINFRLGNFGAASNCYITQLPVNDESGVLQHNLGKCFFELGQLTSATKHFSIAVQLRGTKDLEDIEQKYVEHIRSTCPVPLGGWNDEIFEFESWIDIALLRQKFRDATRTSIQRLATECKGEIAYAFALCSYCDAHDFFPSASTEANHQSRQIEHPDLQLRWSPFDWEYERFGDELFTDVCEFVQTTYNREPRFKEINESSSLFHGDVLSQMVLALHDLRGESVFDHFPTITVFCTETESDGWLETYSAKLLNHAPIDSLLLEQFETRDLHSQEMDSTFRRFRKRLIHSRELPDVWH